MRARPEHLLALPVALLLTACGGGGGASASASRPGTDASAEADVTALPGTVTVFAASSLTDAFGDVAAAFVAAHPEVDVDLSFGSSSSLREQILAGAPADVFASADTSIVERLVEAGEATDPETFATNRLQIVVPDDNPEDVEELADFARSELLLGLCAAEVPCGRLAREALAAAGVTPSIDTAEPDVRALLTKVQVGELDAGIVYRTDVLSAGGAVEGIDLPVAVQQVAPYPIVVLEAAADQAVAAAFVDFVLSHEGQAILRSHGFGAA